MPRRGEAAGTVKILLIRLSAFGDILHTLPAAASLRRTVPGAQLTWLVDPKWAMLLAGNPDVDEVLQFNRREPESLGRIWRELRERRFDRIVDAQGLLKSAALARMARLERGPGAGRYGFGFGTAREGLAAAVYSHRLRPLSAHVVDRNLELAEMAGAQARVVAFPLPEGRAEGGALPEGPYVLCAPFAGWGAKQWPLERYSELARGLASEGLRLVANVAPGDLGRLAAMGRPEEGGVWAHTSGLEGLIQATRRARAVVGLDSGPLHLAAALGKPGVALFGPTDPARNGPYGGTIKVLRQPGAATSYRRDQAPSAAMAAISPKEVLQALRECLATCSLNPTPTS